MVYTAGMKRMFTQTDQELDELAVAGASDVKRWF